MDSARAELEIRSGNRTFGKSFPLNLDSKNEPSFNCYNVRLMRLPPLTSNHATCGNLVICHLIS